MKGTGDSDDLLDVPDIFFSMVDGVVNPGNSGNNGLVGINVICEGNCLTCSAKCLNGGTSMWNLWYGGCNVFLV